jgi:phospholipase C
MEVPTCILAVVAAGLALGNPLQAPETRDAFAADIGHAIKKLVVLVMENQSFDRLYGGQSYDPTLRGIDHRHPPCYDANSTDPNNHEEVCATPDATNLIPEDPDHSYPGTTYSLYVRVIHTR